MRICCIDMAYSLKEGSLRMGVEKIDGIFRPCIEAVMVSSLAEGGFAHMPGRPMRFCPFCGTPVDPEFETGDIVGVPMEAPEKPMPTPVPDKGIDGEATESVAEPSKEEARTFTMASSTVFPHVRHD